MQFKCEYILSISDYGVDPEYFNKLYNDEKGYYEFACCFNVLHELGHALYHAYSDFNNRSNTALGILEEELLVNDFAVAFWKLFGDSGFLERMFSFSKKQTIERKPLLVLYDPESNKIYECEDYKIFFRQTAHLLNDQLTFSSIAKDHSKYYDYFQSCSIVESFENKISLNDVLPIMGIKNFDSFNATETLAYEYDINTPEKVLSDIDRIFTTHGVDIPRIHYYVEKSLITNRIKPLS